MNEELKKYVQAYIDGEEVEYKVSTGTWYPVTELAEFEIPNRKFIIVSSKPKKVKMWQWIFAGDHYAPNTTSAFYKNEEDARKYIESHADIIWIKKAEWTEIEVEE